MVRKVFKFLNFIVLVTMENITPAQLYTKRGYDSYLPVDQLDELSNHYDDLDFMKREFSPELLHTPTFAKFLKNYRDFKA